jgi:hypothetical protein
MHIIAYTRLFQSLVSPSSSLLRPHGNGRDGGLRTVAHTAYALCICTTSLERVKMAPLKLWTALAALAPEARDSRRLAFGCFSSPHSKYSFLSTCLLCICFCCYIWLNIKLQQAQCLYIWLRSRWWCILRLYIMT